MTAPSANPTPDKARTETYARAICRVYVEETARVMRIKVTEAWIVHRVNSRWPEYVGQAVVAMAIADAEMATVEFDKSMSDEAIMLARQACKDAWLPTIAFFDDQIGYALAKMKDAEERAAAAESHAADLRRERNALVAAMAGTVEGGGGAEQIVSTSVGEFS